MTLAVLVLTAVSAALLVPHRPALAPPRRRGGAGLVLVGCCGAVAVWLHGQTLALALIAAAGLAGVGRLLARTRAARGAADQELRVVELCEALAGELRAGQPPVRGLEHCAVTWPELDPVAAAVRLGADVPAALRRAAGWPGAERLRDLAAAWQVSAGSGTGLAAASTRVAESVRHRHATRSLVAGELASARATAWLVALLPLVSLALGAGMGGDPWRFLLETTPGLVCLAAGLALALAGLAWVDRIAAQVQRR
ncbi:MAG TPA: type II secretion system F family protein [Nocardioidaceae bacterium]|nr:type II secretion system F family protein [Nocardioidaceae bacterium]